MPADATVNPAAAARTVAATCVHVELVLTDPRDDALSVDDLGFLADGGGNCFVLIGPDSETPQGLLRAICHSGEPSLPELHLVGRCGRTLPWEFWTPALEEAVLRRREWRDRSAGRNLRDAVRVLPLLVNAVHLCVPADGGGASHELAVSVEAFDTARPDPWLSGGPAAARWLEAHRQHELRVLAERALGLGGSAPSDSAVAVDRLTQHALGLRLLSHAGVHRVNVGLPPGLECPCATAQWVDDEAALG